MAFPTTNRGSSSATGLCSLAVSAALLFGIGCTQATPLPALGASLATDTVEILAAPDAMVIYALHPHRLPGQSDPESAILADTFHDFVIIGEAAVPETSVRRRVLELVDEGVSQHNGISALCFTPRHGVRVQKGESTVDLVICYECFSLKIYGPGGHTGQALTDSAVSNRLTEIFEAHGLEIHGNTG